MIILKFQKCCHSSDASQIGLLSAVPPLELLCTSPSPTSLQKLCLLKTNGCKDAQLCSNTQQPPLDLGNPDTELSSLLPLCCSLRPLDCSPGLDSSVHGIFQARILEWVAISFSRGSPRPRDGACNSCIGRSILYRWATREAPSCLLEVSISSFCSFLF